MVSRAQGDAVIVIGADSHKRTHTVVAVDQVGRWLGERTVRATSDGHLELLRWSAQWPQVMFALEDCRHLTRRLEQDLLAAGQRVVRVPTRLMAATRRGGRHPGKSDAIDAEAVALAALRHHDLPVAALDGPTREVKLLVDYRRDLVRQRTRVANRLRWHRHELDPTLQIPSRGLRRYKVIDELAARLAGVEGTVARLARQLLARCRELTAEIKRPGGRATAAGPSAGTSAVGRARLRGAGGGDDPGRDRRGRPVPLQGCLRPLHRHRPDPGVVGRSARQGAAEPGRQPDGKL